MTYKKKDTDNSTKSTDNVSLIALTGGYAWIARSLQEVINEHFIFFDTERKGVTYIQ